MAPASIPAASALQLSFDGLKIKNPGSGKLLGGGDRLHTEPPENLSKSPKTTQPGPKDDDERITFGPTSLLRSFGLGPNRFVDATTKDSDFGLAASFLDFGFFGVTDWSLALLLLAFLVVELLREEREEEERDMGSGRGSKGGWFC